MKKVFLLIFLLLTLTVSNISAQRTTLYKKQSTLTVNFMLNDYISARAISNTSLGEAIANNTFSKVTEMFPGLSISYYKGITDHVDFMASLGGSSPKYDFKDGKSTRSAKLLLEADAAVNLKLLPDNYRVIPYATAGVGISLYGVHYGAYIPMGMGVQFRLGEDAFLFTNL